MKHYEYIRINYDHLSEGDSDTGSNTERCYRTDELGDNPSRCDLTVTNEDGILKYHCFSASCPCSGRTDTGTKVWNGRPAKKRIPVQKFASDLPLVQNLPRRAVEYLEANNVSPANALDSGMRFDPIEHRLVFPVEISGMPRGYVYRNIRQDDSDVRPRKWIRMKGFKGATIPFEGKGDTCYFVEALTSALFLKEHTDAPVLAMLSIMFDESKRTNTRKWLRLQGVKNIVIMPDPDVSQTILIKLKRELTRDGFNIRVVRNKSKPRFCTPEQLLK